MDDRDDTQLVTPKISLPEPKEGLPQIYLDSLSKEARELAVSLHRIASRVDWLCDNFLESNRLARLREVRIIQLEKSALDQASFRSGVTIKAGLFFTAVMIILQIVIPIVVKHIP